MWRASLCQTVLSCFLCTHPQGRLLFSLLCRCRFPFLGAMLSEGAVSAILYGHFRQDSYSTIQQTLQQINLSASLGAISAVIAKHTDSKGRVRAKNKFGTGNHSSPKQKLSNTVKGKIIKYANKHRGRARVTSQYLQKKMPETKKASDRTIRRILSQNDIYLERRRKKQCVTKINKSKRIAVAKRLCKTNPNKLFDMGFTDGATIFIAKSEAQRKNNFMASLGPFVYRKKHEGLLYNCVGPSDYAKGKGDPVKFWGLLRKGVLKIHVLAAGQSMNGTLKCAPLRGRRS